jgi:formate-dependent nitrite reductase membrane component NrfD
MLVEPILASVVWHWWIAVFLAIGSIVALVATIVGYLAKVENPRFPRR